MSGEGNSKKALKKKDVKPASVSMLTVEIFWLLCYSDVLPEDAGRKVTCPSSAVSLFSAMEFLLFSKILVDM
jgi:hypothetical protein